MTILTNSTNSSARGWLEGTLDVISGMAPRPSTPASNYSSGNNNGNSISSNGNHNIHRHYSTPPGSPRNNSNPSLNPGGGSSSSSSGGGGGIGLVRLPSMDSLDRSLHNDSGHGNKSTAQIIRDLRASNARLTARTAELEADFMNQMAVAARSQELRHKQMQQKLDQSIQASQQWEMRALSAERRLREQVESVQIMREESAFQRHAISSLKTQLRQQQPSDGSVADCQGTTVIGSSLNASSSSPPPLSSSSVPQQCQHQYVVLRQQLEQLQHELGQEAAAKLQFKHQAAMLQSAIDQLQSQSQQQQQHPLGDIQDLLLSSSSLLSETPQQQPVAELQQQLHETEQALSTTQQALSKQVASHALELAALQDEHAAALVMEREVNHSNSNKSTKSNRTSSTSQQHQQQHDKDWQDQMIERDDTVLKLRQQVLEYSRQLTDLTAEVAKVRAQAEQQEHDRRDEVDDLRILHDAQEEEIESLRKQLEESCHEIELRDQELHEKNRRLAEWEQQQQNHSDSATTKALTPSLLDSSMQEDDEAAEREIEELRQMVDRLQQELEDVRREHQDQVAQLKRRVQESTALVDQAVLDTPNRKALRGKDDSSRSNSSRNINNTDSLEDSVDDRSTTTPLSSTSSRSPARVEQLRARHVAMENQYQKAKQAYAASEREKEKLVEEFRRKLSNVLKEKDLAEQQFQYQMEAMKGQLDQVRAQQSCSVGIAAAGEPTGDDAVTCSSRQLQRTAGGGGGGAAQGSNGSGQQSGGSLEEDLRKQLEQSKKSVERLRSQLEHVKEDREREMNELREKLSDRDTTISALVKSSVSLEQQIVTTKLEMDLLQAKLDAATSRSGSCYNDQGVDIIVATDPTTGGRGMGCNGGPSAELTELRSSVTAYRENREKLAQEVHRLKRQLHYSKLEVSRLKNQYENVRKENHKLKHQQHQHPESSTAGSLCSALVPTSPTTTTMATREEMQERDEAISSLVQQSLAQEKVIADLKQDLMATSQELDALRRSNHLPTWDEVNKLREEAEMFAGQVIELDDEISALKVMLNQRDGTIETLQADVTRLQQEIENHPIGPTPIDDQVMMDLEAELDERQEENQVLRNEVRSLRRELRDVQVSADEAKTEAETARTKADALQEQWQALVLEKERAVTELHQGRGRMEDLEQQLDEAKQELDELQTVQAESNARHAQLAANEVEVDALRKRVESLEQSLSVQSAAVDSAKDTIRELERMLAEKTANASSAYEEEKEELLAEIDQLTQQLKEVQEQLEAVRQDRQVIADFKEKLELADEARTEETRSIVENYERRIKLITMDRDVTMDKLRKELASEKEQKAVEAEKLTKQLELYESEMKELEESATEQVEQREAKIVALETALQAQEQLVNNMKTEMDHLQSSMESTAVGRREEIEEMQQELYVMTSKVATYQREVESLRSGIEEQRLKYEAEVTKLKDTIASVEKASAPSEHRNAADLQHELRLAEVKERLEKLTWRNASLKKENESLRERLAKTELKMHAGSRQPDKTSELVLELAAKTEQLQELQQELERARTVVAASPPSPTPMAPPALPIVVSNFHHGSKPPMMTSPSLSSSSRATPVTPLISDSGNNSKPSSAASPRLGFRLLKPFRSSTSSSNHAADAEA